MMLRSVFKRSQQVPTLLCIQMNIQRILGQKYPQFHANHWIRRVERMRRCNIVGCIVQTHATLLCYASMIAKQKKCWMLHLKFDQFQTSCNNIQQVATTCNMVCKRSQHVASNNVACCCTTMLRSFARGFRVAFQILGCSQPLLFYRSL